MSNFILIIAAMYIAIGVLLLIKPKALFDFMSKYMKSYGLQLISLVLGILFGVIFFISADSTRFPGFFELFGLLAGAGGIIAIIIPRSDFQKLISWEIKTFSPYGRPLGVIEGMFGVFLIYTVM